MSYSLQQIYAISDKYFGILFFSIYLSICAYLPIFLSVYLPVCVYLPSVFARRE